MEEAKCKNCRGKGIVSGGATEESKNYREGKCYYCKGTGIKSPILL